MRLPVAFFALMCAGFLSACGVETATTAATVAAAKTKEAQEAKKTEARVLEQLGAASQQAKQRLQDADSAGR